MRGLDCLLFLRLKLAFHEICILLWRTIEIIAIRVAETGFIVISLIPNFSFLDQARGWNNHLRMFTGLGSSVVRMLVYD